MRLKTKQLTKAHPLGGALLVVNKRLGQSITNRIWYRVDYGISNRYNNEENGGSAFFANMTGFVWDEVCYQPD